MSSSILVVGGAGIVGRQVLRALRERRADVRALVHQNALHGFDSVRGDLGNRDSLVRALVGVDAVCFISPHSPNEGAHGTNLLDACEAAHVRRVVFMSAYHPHASSRVTQRLLDEALLTFAPHYRPKLALERRVRWSSMSPVVLCPSNFYQNDELGLGELFDGAYLNPFGERPVSRIDTRDVGDAAARALLDDVPSGVYPVIGPADWTGPQCAEVWSAALGRSVTYGGNDLTTWRATIKPRMEPAKAEDMDRTLRILQRHGASSSEHDRAATQALLGRPARAFEAYAAEVGAWKIIPGRMSA